MVEFAAEDMKKSGIYGNGMQLIILKFPPLIFRET